MVSVRQVLVFGCVAAVLFATATTAQEEGGLSREIVEHLLKVVSPSCRDEMQSAMQEQGTEISLECKEEIQAALVEQQQASQGNGAPRQTPPAQPRDSTATYLVLLFTLGLLGALGALSYFVHTKKEEAAAKYKKKDTSHKGAKWQKRQAEKARRKGSSSQML